ncbi:MAG: thiamine diphosphokinase [Bacteroidota bacterium]
MTPSVLILANGRPPKKSLFTSLRKEASFFVCADGGANTAARFNERPDLIIGDLDSIKATTVKKFSSVVTRRVADQNSTDLEKALAWVIRKGYRRIDVVGATGGRPDHLAGNLSALGKFSRQASVRFIDDDGILTLVGSSCTFDAPPGTTISLIPLSRCEGIVTSGLRWELRNGVLELGFRESTSNIVKKSPVTINVRRGALLLYRLHDSAS